MEENGAGMFWSVVEMKDNYFMMHCTNQDLQYQLDRAIKDADLVRSNYLEIGIVDPIKVTKGHLALKNWKLKNELLKQL